MERDEPLSSDGLASHSDVLNVPSEHESVPKQLL